MPLSYRRLSTGKGQNKNQGGGSKLQGLPATRNMPVLANRATGIRAGGERRNYFFLINQLSGGVGKMFSANAGRFDGAIGTPNGPGPWGNNGGGSTPTPAQGVIEFETSDPEFMEASTNDQIGAYYYIQFLLNDVAKPRFAFNIVSSAADWDLTSAEVIVVSGGGGGGGARNTGSGSGYAAGGGGGGGAVYKSNSVVLVAGGGAAAQVEGRVGRGGVGGNGNPNWDGEGGYASSFYGGGVSESVEGGDGGGAASAGEGAPGGGASDGGGEGSGDSEAPGSPGEGAWGGGGGGDQGNGEDASPSGAGDGGNGRTLGGVGVGWGKPGAPGSDDAWEACGGGGGGATNGEQGLGQGNGGDGGTGGASSAGGNALANYGGGGGGAMAKDDNTSGEGGSGAHGCVTIRWLVT